MGQQSWDGLGSIPGEYYIHRPEGGGWAGKQQTLPSQTSLRLSQQCHHLHYPCMKPIRMCYSQQLSGSSSGLTAVAAQGAASGGHYGMWGKLILGLQMTYYKMFREENKGGENGWTEVIWGRTIMGKTGITGLKKPHMHKVLWSVHLQAMPCIQSVLAEVISLSSWNHWKVVWI